MGARKGFIRLLGIAYGLLYRVPVVGDPLVKAVCRGIAFIQFHSPYRLKRADSIGVLRKDFERLVEVMDMDVEVTGEDEEKLELTLRKCPYGFSRPGQLGVCDAAMEMDRAMFGYAGCKLVIDECIPGGAPVCRLSVHLNA
jgi:hypothetical protein